MKTMKMTRFTGLVLSAAMSVSMAAGFGMNIHAAEPNGENYECGDMQGSENVPANEPSEGAGGEANEVLSPAKPDETVTMPDVSVPADQPYEYMTFSQNQNYIVSFDGNVNGTVSFDETVCGEGCNLQLYPNVIPNDGYCFVGWALDPAGNCAWNEWGDVVMQPITLYAQYVKMPMMTAAPNPAPAANNAAQANPQQTNQNTCHHEHHMVLKTIYEPTETTDGVMGYVCDGCGYVGTTYVIPMSEAIIRNRYQQIDQAKPGQTIRLTMGEMNSFSRAFMMKIAAKNTTNFIIDYTYQHVKYETVIPAGTVVDTSLEWYGPLKMGQLYRTYRLN